MCQGAKFNGMRQKRRDEEAEVSGEKESEDNLETKGEGDGLERKLWKDGWEGRVRTAWVVKAKCGRGVAKVLKGVVRMQSW